jgi:hypothetical protein
MTSFHETYRPHDVPKASSPRAFGFLFAALLALLAVERFFTGRAWPWYAVAAAAFAAVALARPAWLAPVNTAWLALGALLHRVASPVALALLYAGVFTPIAMLMRLRGKDPMRLNPRPPGESYWIDREPPAADHFTRQF